MNVEVRNLTRSFDGRKAVDALSFAFSSGDIFGFIGPNGAGKTTTLRIMATLDLPDFGDVFYDGVSAVTHPEKVRPLIGFMPDSLPESNDIRVWEYLDFFARAYGLQGRSREEALRKVEELTQLGDFRDKFVKHLSKGMKQRVSMARALIHDPAVLIMDEPAAGLDPRARLELRELLRTLAEEGKAILLSSHILTELQDVCNGAVILEQGRLLSAGTLAELRVGRGCRTADLLPIVVEALNGPAALAEIARTVPGVAAVHPQGQVVILETAAAGESDVAAILQKLIAAGAEVTRFEPRRMNLEQLFMAVTAGKLQ